MGQASTQKGKERAFTLIRLCLRACSVMAEKLPGLRARRTLFGWAPLQLFGRSEGQTSFALEEFAQASITRTVSPTERARGYSPGQLTSPTPTAEPVGVAERALNRYGRD